MPTTEYLEALLNSAKKYLPSWLMTELHKLALPSAGGKARWREPEEPSFLEKMALSDIRPEKLKDAPEDDVRMAWLRLHQWYGAAKKRGEAVEGVVNAALWVMDAFEHRGWTYEDSDLVQEARKLQGVKKAQSIEAKLANLPAEVVVVPNFVSVVGSAVSKEKPNDIDVLIRANRDEKGEHFLIQSDNVWLPVRKVLDPEKKGSLHFIDSPQGSHADFVPCYSLVLRREEPKRQVVKEGGLLGPITVVGVKSRIADEIIALFPEHTAYVEPYAGGAKVFWAKEPSSKEVLNDSDAGIVSVYRFVKGASDQELTAFAGRNWEATEERFDRLANSHPGKLADSAYRVWYLSRFGFISANSEAGDFRHAGSAGEVANVSIERLQKLQERLKDVALLNMDALSVIKEHDAPSTLFYLGPPYPAGRTEDLYQHEEDAEHFGKLTELLRSVKGKFILSCNKESLDLVEVPKAWTTKEIEARYTSGSQNRRTGNELLVMNFKPAVAKAEPVEKAVRPGQRFSPQKPLMAGTTEYFSTDELWPWAQKRLEGGAGLVGEIKYDGFRTILSRDGGKVSVWFEDAKEDRAEGLPALVEAAKKSPHESFVLDGEMLATHGGKLVPRVQLMETLTGKSPWKPLYFVFDCLYLDGEDISEKPLSDRREAAEEVVAGFKSDLATFSKAVPIEDRQDLEIVGKWAASQPGSEGLMVKDATKAYEFGGSDDWSKWKTVCELKVIVLAVEKTANGYTYQCGLREPGDFENTTEFRGEKYVDLGKTFVTPEKVASEGDTLNVRIEELIIQYDDGGLELAWGKPTVAGPDKSRPAYLAAQAVDVAKRGHALKEEVQKAVPHVPSAGPQNAKVAFVGASPGPIEAARKEPFVGPAGAVLNESFLKPLGLSREQVFLTNAVPLYLTDEKGNVREPTPREVEEWKPWLTRQLDEVHPGIVVALGQTAKAALGDRADFTLPHPSAIRRFGDSGELARKLKQIKRALEEVRKADDEGETTAEAAAKFWADNWFKMFPPDGKGRFVYDHHWRGLSEDESKLDEKELLDTSHSLHGDLRFEADGKLWGFSVFLGTTQDNRRAGGDRLATLPQDDNLQGQFKLAQPTAWLQVGVGKPMVTEPGGVGATSEKYSKFFAYDRGAYEIGCWREHMLEVFLHGDKLKGRFLIEYAPIGGRRIWIIDRPSSQVGYAKSHDLADVISELRGKGQKHLIWRDPEEGGKPRLIDVESARVAKEYYAQILKADDEKQIVYGVVLEPETVDTQGDVISADETEEAAHKFLVKSRVVGDRHSKKAGAEVVESYVAPVAFELGGQNVKKGSWVLGVHITDTRLWREVKSGEYTGFSVGGFGVREAVA